MSGGPLFRPPTETLGAGPAKFRFRPSRSWFFKVFGRFFLKKLAEFEEILNSDAARVSLI